MSGSEPRDAMETMFLLLIGMLHAAVPSKPQVLEKNEMSLHQRLLLRSQSTPKAARSTLIFDLPLTYNARVSQWLQYFQTKGENWFGTWLEKSSRYMPYIQRELKAHGLPQDLAFMVMIESGFEAGARSHAGAVGPWQFIQPTGERYGLKVLWWLDERKDLSKSTRAAIRYLKDLYREFGSWYLVAASYNMGENGLRRQIQKYKTRDFWQLSRLGALPQETIDYVPKILAAMMIAKSPGLYGFQKVSRLDAIEFDTVTVPGGTDLGVLADHLGVTRKALRDLNAELIVGFVPNMVQSHKIRVPKGAAAFVASR